MKKYSELTKEELLTEQADLEAEYEKIKGLGLSLDMSRGKPGADQLDLSMPMMSLLNEASVLKSENGTDLRNYGMLDGIPEAKRLMAEMMDVEPEMVMVYGNSSLNIMYDQIARACYDGICGNTPWSKLDQPVKFLCPVPGYDRHFAITEHFGIEMLNITMTADGPDMDAVEEAVKDPLVKGIWCVPKYSNPEGVVYSDDTVRRFAALKPAAKDFRIFWDNAYAVHHLYDDNQPEILNIFKEAEKNNNEDLIFEFASTSKVTFPGSGIAAIATSEANRKDIRSQLTFQTIGYDKINQLRHVAFLKDKEGVRAQMSKHAALIRPKFEMLDDMLTKEISSRGIGSWIKPLGGYFISFNALDGCAKEIIRLCKEAGVTMTGAGSPFPYKKDPKDSVIRIAPTYPSLEDLTKAAEIFVTVTRLVSVKKYLAD